MAATPHSRVESSDIRASAPEYIDHAAQYLKKSPQRRKVFAAIYQNKSRTKTVEYLMQKTNMTRVRVLQLADQLDAHDLAVKNNNSGSTLTYSKDKFYAKNYRRVLELAENPAKLKKLITKRSPAVAARTVKIIVPAKAKVQEVFVDDLFKKVNGVKATGPIILAESKVKAGIKKIIGETGIFKDWGGEKSDLYTTKITLRGKRIASAIAFKGKATSGKLTPEKMGKRGDQILRLFQEPAELLLVVYGGQIDSSIKTQMQLAATNRALAGQKINYGVIDGDDLARLIAAYPAAFK